MQHGLDCFYFLDSPRQDDDLVYLFPTTDAILRLIEPNPPDAALDEMRIPDVESWFPGDLSLAHIHEVMLVHIVDRRPKKGPEELLAEFYESKRRSAPGGESDHARR